VYDRFLLLSCPWWSQPSQKWSQPSQKAWSQVQKIEFDLNVLIGFDQDAEKWWAKN